jgi:transcriptional regulator with XRE-family HTH domain
MMPSAEEIAVRLGNEIRAQRKTLGVNATATAEAAGISRVTLHRIERGEGSVSLAAYLKVLTALGLDLDVINTSQRDPVRRQEHASIPVRISLSAYPILKGLAWQVHGTDSLTPQEAWDIYDRNHRHIDMSSAGPEEAALMDALRQVFARGSS